MKYWRPPAHPKFVHLQRGIKQNWGWFSSFSTRRGNKIELVFYYPSDITLWFTLSLSTPKQYLVRIVCQPISRDLLLIDDQNSFIFFIFPLLSNCRSAMGVVFITNAKPWPIISCLQQRFRLITLNLWLLKCWS